MVISMANESMHEGTLRYDGVVGRLYVDDDREIDGRRHFHCGETLQIRRGNGKWRDTRVEMNADTDSWYLVGLYKPGQIPAGLRARF